MIPFTEAEGGLLTLLAMSRIKHYKMHMYDTAGHAKF